jgi:hypothetical protein
LSEKPTYRGPVDASSTTEDDVLDALGFLIIIEPELDDETINDIDDYHAHLAPWNDDIDRAMATLRQFAVQRQPQSLPEMEAKFYEILDDERVDLRPKAISVALGSLSKAWHGVGLWRK